MAVMLSPRTNKNQDPQSVKLFSSNINGEDLSQINVIYYETVTSENTTQLVQKDHTIEMINMDGEELLLEKLMPTPQAHELIKKWIKLISSSHYSWVFSEKTVYIWSQVE
ncbi:MAG: hypothetical protein AB7N99_09745 [Simkaniaceae bacterium]